MTEPNRSNELLLDWKSAEAAAVVHMKTLGFLDAQVTAEGPDGGIDAVSGNAAAQVKFYATPVGRPDIQRLRGAARAHRFALFYSTGGYTREATAFADDAEVALFAMDPFGRCSAASHFASVLLEPAESQERRRRANEFRAVQYRLALSAFDADLARLTAFGKRVDLGIDTMPTYNQISQQLDDAVAAFRLAVEEGDFERADRVFESIQRCTSILVWATAELNVSYKRIEDAIEEGWRREATLDPEASFARAANQVFELKVLLRDSLSGWEDHFAPTGVKLAALINDETTMLAGMLLSASWGTPVLPRDLLVSLSQSVDAGVKRGMEAAMKAFNEVLRLLRSAHLDTRVTTSEMIRCETIAVAIAEQLSEAEARL